MKVLDEGFDFGSLITAMVRCQRPAMYFGSEYTFDSVVSYLDGYYEGLQFARLPRSPEMRVVPETDWDGFKRWLAENNISFAELKNEFPNHQDALNVLNRKLSQFSELLNIATATIH